MILLILLYIASDVLNGCVALAVFYVFEIFISLGLGKNKLKVSYI